MNRPPVDIDDSLTSREASLLGELQSFSSWQSAG